MTYLKLESGNYKLIEVSSPAGYVLDKNGVDFTIGNDTHFAYTTYGPIITMYVKNTPIKGQIEIYKKGELFAVEDETFNYNNRVTLEAIVYNIYAEEDIKSSDGNHLYFEKGTLVGTMITNKEGYAISELLPLGKYIVKELKTNDFYVLDKNEYHIELTEKDNRTEVVYSSHKMTNILKKGTLEFTKIDLVTGDPIPNTIIEVYTEKNQKIFEGTTDENGKIIIKNLSVGQKFYIIEKNPATGYIITEEKVYFEITDDGEVVKAEMKNKPITSGLEFTKLDFSTNDPIPNTLIEIYSVNNEENPIFSGRTDENGKIIIDELRYGKYFILEKETASDKYILNTERLYFEIKKDGEIVKSTMKNEKIKSKLVIHKVDENNNPLSGVKFGIFDMNGKLLDTITTDKNGIAEITKEFGTYYYQELSTIDGFVLKEDKITFDVKQHNEVIESTMINEKKPIPVPDTELNDYHFVDFISLCLIIIGTGVIIYEKSQKKK